MSPLERTFLLHNVEVMEMQLKALKSLIVRVSNSEEKTTITEIAKKEAPNVEYLSDEDEERLSLMFAPMKEKEEG